MEKLSGAQVDQMMKVAAKSLRALSEANSELKEKLAHFEKKERAEKIAAVMEEKNLNNELSFEEKVAKLMSHDKLEVVEEAVGMSSPQMKIASLVDRDGVSVSDGHEGNDLASDQFAEGLASF